MQIPLIIACCLESSVYRRWHPEQSGISPLYQEIRASHTLSKVLGRVTHQTTLWVPADHWALDIELIAGHKVSVLLAANNQALWVQQPAVIPFISKPPKTGRCRAASLISPKARELVLRKRTMPRKVRAGSRPQATSRRLLISRSAFTPRTPSPGLVSYSASTRTPTLSLTSGRKSRKCGKGRARTVPRRAAPCKTPADHHLLRKSCQPIRCSKMECDKKYSCSTHTLMLGIMPTRLWTGQHETP